MKDSLQLRDGIMATRNNELYWDNCETRCEGTETITVKIEDDTDPMKPYDFNLKRENAEVSS